MAGLNQRKKAWLKRKQRIRSRIKGTPDRPRLCVSRSSKHIYAQIIDDTKGQTLVAASSLETSFKDGADKKGKIGFANQIGKNIAERAKAVGVKKIVFDRNGYLYHGRIKAVSDGAREGGLEF